MKKSNAFLSKFNSSKDVFNGLSAFTVVAVGLFAILIIIGTLTPTIENKKIVFMLAKTLADKHPYSYYFSSNQFDYYALICPFITAIIQFCFLHRKDNCYTLLSFGKKRATLYKNRLLPPLISMLAIMLVVKIIALIINIRYIGFTPSLLGAWAVHVLLFSQMILFIYAIAVFCCHMCGRTIEAIAASVSFALLPPALSLVINHVFYFSLYGVSSRGNDDIITRALGIMNPLPLEAFVESMLKTSFDPSPDFKATAIFSGIWLVFSIALLIYTKHYFEKKYKPEISEFKGAKTLIVYTISLCAPLLFAYFGLDYVRGYFYPLNNTQVKFFAIACAFLCGIIGAVLCNFIIHFTFKRIKVALVAGITIGAITGIALLVGATGIFGTYNKLPELKEVESVEVYAPFFPFGDDDGSNNYITNYYHTSNVLPIFTSEKEIQLVLDIHKQVLDDREAQSVSAFTVTYNLKDGTTYQREYTYLSNSALEKAMELLDTPTIENYIKGQLIPEAVYKPRKEEHPSGNVSTVFTEDTVIRLVSKHYIETDVADKLTPQQSFELRNAVQSDITAMTYDQWFRPTGEYLGYIFFSTVTDKHLEYEPFCFSNNFVYTAPIYDNMSKTIAVLEKYDLLSTLTKEREITRLYTADLQELITWLQEPVLESSDSEYLLNPYFANMNYVTLEDTDKWGNKDSSPLKEITNPDEIEKILNESHGYHLVDNNTTYVLAEFRFDSYDHIRYGSYVIPSK